MSWPMPRVEDEIAMLQLFSASRVVALTLNHEGMSNEDVRRVVAEYEAAYGLPTCDPLWDGCEKLVAMVRGML